MRKININTVFTLFIFIFNFTRVIGQEAFPEPKIGDNQLFYLQRAKNTNTIVYEVNQKDGVLDKENPFIYYWVMYNEKGQKEELTNKEKNKAFGLKIDNFNNDKYEISFVSLDALKMNLVKGIDKKFQIIANIKNKKAILKRVFLEFKGVFWSPKIKSILLEGKEIETKATISEKLNFD